MIGWRGTVLLIACGFFSALLVTGTPVPRPAQAAEGGTTYSFDGTTVTITVHMDFCCADVGNDWQVASVEGSVKAAEDGWNEALARLQYDGCLQIRVVFIAHVQTKYGWEAGYHQIYPMFGTPGRSHSKDPGTKDPTVDTTTAYYQPLEGFFYTTSLSVEGWEHEIGHLMGLGDDYRDVTLSITLTTGGITHHGTMTVAKPLPGREGTLMDGGDTIDQPLADRLGDIASRAGMKVSARKGCSVVVEGRAHWHTKYPDTTEAGDNQPYEEDSTLTWRTVYPEVGVRIQQYSRDWFSFLPDDRWHPSGQPPVRNAADPQGATKVTFTGQNPRCDVRTSFTLPMYPIALGGGRNASKFDFSASFSVLDHGFQEHVLSAIQAGCRPVPTDARGNPVGPFSSPVLTAWGLGRGNLTWRNGEPEFTDEDGLVWRLPTGGADIDFQIVGHGDFPVTLLKDGKSFTLRTKKIVWDHSVPINSMFPPCRHDSPKACFEDRFATTHAEGEINVKFAHLRSR